MRQRNASPYPLYMPTLEPAREVAPGEVLDHPTLLAGFESLEKPTTDPEPPSDETEGDVPVPSGSDQAADAETEGQAAGEQATPLTEGQAADRQAAPLTGRKSRR